MITPDQLENRDVDATTPIDRICRRCGTRFRIPVGELALLRERYGDAFRLPVRCSDCREDRKLEEARIVDDGRDDSLVCANCGTTFLFTAREKRWYLERFSPRACYPRHCPSCRENRRTRAHD
jgi:hypothetical protein